MTLEQIFKAYSSRKIFSHNGGAVFQSILVTQEILTWQWSGFS